MVRPVSSGSTSLLAVVAELELDSVIPPPDKIEEGNSLNEALAKRNH